MNDRPVSVTLIGAWLLWAASIALGWVYFFTGQRGVALLSLLFVAGAVTVTIRHYFCRFADMLLERERNAFDLGMDAGRIRSLR